MNTDAALLALIAELYSSAGAAHARIAELEAENSQLRARAAQADA